MENLKCLQHCIHVLYFDYVHPRPSCMEFVFLGRKQDSSEGVGVFMLIQNPGGMTRQQRQHLTHLERVP